MMLALIGSVLAAPLNLWGGAAAPGVVGVTPVVYASASDVSSSVLLATGIGSKADVTAGIGMVSTFGGPASVGALDTMARIFPADGVALGLHTTWTPGDTYAVVGPEVHVAKVYDRVGFTANAGWRANLGDTGSALSAGVAPEVWIHPKVSGYVELDTSYTFGDGVAMMAVPGISAVLDADGAHSLSAGLQVPVYPEVGPVSGGFWYTVILGG